MLILLWSSWIVPWDPFLANYQAPTPQKFPPGTPNLDTLQPYGCCAAWASTPLACPTQPNFAHEFGQPSPRTVWGCPKNQPAAVQTV